MSTKIKIRRDLKQNWQQHNPVLGDGEIALIKDTGHVKIGNGTDNFNDLNVGRFVECLIDAHQSSDVWGKELYFDNGIYLITIRAYTSSKDIDVYFYDINDSVIDFSTMTNQGNQINNHWSGVQTPHRFIGFSYAQRATYILDAFSGVVQGTQDFIYDEKRIIANRSYVCGTGSIKKMVFESTNTDGSNDNTPLRLRILRLY